MIEAVKQKLRDFDEVYVDGTQWKYSHKLNVAFRGLVFRFEKLADAGDCQLFKEIWETNLIEQNAGVDLTISHLYQPEFSKDEFKLEVKSANEIYIETENIRAFQYALEALSYAFEKVDEDIYLTKIMVHHCPSFAVRGIIEGFYGKPWTHEMRLDAIDYCAEKRMNTYMYAPKDDQLQRKLWRELYSEQKIDEFKELLARAEEKKIDFYYMISPGNDIDYCLPEEVAVLTAKLQQMIDLGINHFGLLLDDIDYILSGDKKIRFNTAANAHSFLINQVNRFLESKIANYKLVACPTEYDNRYGSVYLEELTAKTDNNVAFFWTGPSTLASEITTEDINKMTSVYKRPMIIWDNVPVNDFQKDNELVFLTPYENRSPHLADKRFNVSGIVSNPMPQWELSKPAVGTMANFLWNSYKYDAQQAWKQVADELVGEKWGDSLIAFSQFNPNKYMRMSYPKYILDKISNLDVPFVNQEMNRLIDSILELNQTSNGRFLLELLPWLERGRQDVILWDEIRDGDLQQANELFEKNAKLPNRMGKDLVSSFYRALLSKIEMENLED